MNYYKARFSLSIIVFLGIFFVMSYRVAFAPQQSNTDLAKDSLDIRDYQWKNRLILLFEGESPTVYEEQQDRCLAFSQALKERDVLVFCFSDKQHECKVGTNIYGYSNKYYRNNLNINKNDFQILLIGKDGGIKLQRDTLTRLREIMMLIDKMPMRQQEIGKRKN